MPTNLVHFDIRSHSYCAKREGKGSKFKLVKKQMELFFSMKLEDEKLSNGLSCTLCFICHLT